MKFVGKSLLLVAVFIGAFSLGVCTLIIVGNALR